MEMLPLSVLVTYTLTEPAINEIGMRIPWNIGWPVAAALGFAMLYAAARRAAYYPLKYPRGF